MVARTYSITKKQSVQFPTGKISKLSNYIFRDNYRKELSVIRCGLLRLKPNVMLPIFYYSEEHDTYHMMCEDGLVNLTTGRFIRRLNWRKKYWSYKIPEGRCVRIGVRKLNFSYGLIYFDRLTFETMLATDRGVYSLATGGKVFSYTDGYKLRREFVSRILSGEICVYNATTFIHAPRIRKS